MTHEWRRTAWRGLDGHAVPRPQRRPPPASFDPSAAAEEPAEMLAGEPAADDPQSS